MLPTKAISPIVIATAPQWASQSSRLGPRCSAEMALAASIALVCSYIFRQCSPARLRSAKVGQTGLKNYRFGQTTRPPGPKNVRREPRMTFMPFILDRSPIAKLVRSIDAKNGSLDLLDQLEQLMVHQITTMSYGQLEQAYQRADTALTLVRSDRERELLQSIKAMALRRIQRIHIESRP